MSKTLSNGTLSLRFMQNALRRQQLQEVELERAEVKDEGKWEVGQDVKEAWGIGREQTSELVAHESSYLPFLFSETNDTRNTKPRGRRMFNKKGLDVSQEQPESQPKQEELSTVPDDVAPADEGKLADSDDDRPTKPKGKKSGIHANPRPISATSLGNRSLKGFDSLDESNKPGQSSKSARDAIFSLSGVGTDIRSAKKESKDEDSDDDEQESTPEPEAPSSTGFLKPKGVEEPSSRKPTSKNPSKKKNRHTSASGVVNGARKKRKRDPNEPAGEGRKKRNIKRSVLSRPGAE